MCVERGGGGVRREIDDQIRRQGRLIRHGPGRTRVGPEIAGREGEDTAGVRVPPPRGWGGGYYHSLDVGARGAFRSPAGRGAAVRAAREIICPTACPLSPSLALSLLSLSPSLCLFSLSLSLSLFLCLSVSLSLYIYICVCVCVCVCVCIYIYILLNSLSNIYE